MEMSSKHHRVNTTRDEYSDNVPRDSISGGLSKQRLSEENFVPKIDLGKLVSLPANPNSGTREMAPDQVGSLPQIQRSILKT